MASEISDTWNGIAGIVSVLQIHLRTDRVVPRAKGVRIWTEGVYRKWGHRVSDGESVQAFTAYHFYSHFDLLS